MLHAPSGSSSPMTGVHDAMTATMSPPHQLHQHQPRDQRHLPLPSESNISRHHQQQPTLNDGRAGSSDNQATSTSSVSSSPLRYGNGNRSGQYNVPSNTSTSSVLSPASSSNTSVAATSMPTTAASLMREGPRDFTVIKDVGDGSFGTVCLADWKSPLPSGTLLSPMQHPTTRPEYLGKRLVAIKKMKKPFPNWEECLKLKELKCLLAIPHHPNIIPLYDAFLMPVSKELHFVFECMEGNLYQLTKSRKGRPLAGGLVASIFQQIVKGLHHIHEQGYFHRDMKPENLLITTTGLADYPSSATLPAVGTSSEKDVLVIVKLADFGLARETDSKPPYTEYVSTRWYRAPEVLLRSRDYSNPVDMWALGTILAELVNLKPLFPGQSEVDQVLQICEVLGDPTRDYGRDNRGRQVGGGEWSTGIRMAKNVGFAFPVAQPITFSSLFSSKIPVSLVDCIQDLLRYDPKARLTTQNCLDHVYYQKVAPRLQPAQAKAVVAATTPEQQAMHARAVPRASQLSSMTSVINQSAQRSGMPPSHSTVPQSRKPAFGSTSQRHVSTQDADVAMEVASPPSGVTQWAPTPGGPARDSSISQYPAFPDSASTFAGSSHASMQFDEESMRPTQEGEYSEAQFSTSTVRDPRQYSDQQMYRNAANHQQAMSQQQQQQQSSQDNETEMMYTHEEGNYSRQAIHQQQQQSSQPIRTYDHANQMYRHGRPINQGMPQSISDSRASSDAERRSVDAGPSSDMIPLKERERRKSKGWISSVWNGGAGAGTGAGAGMGATSGNQNRQHQTYGDGTVGHAGNNGDQSFVPTPAQQLAAEHSEKLLAAQQSATTANAGGAAAAPSPPVDPKKAKKMAEKAAREAEKAKRAAQEKAARDRARAVMQKRNQILASSNSRDQVEWLTLADNDMTKALQQPSSTPAPSIFQSETSRGKQPSMSQSSTSEHSIPHYAANSVTSPYSPYGSQSNHVNSPAWQGSRSSSRGKVRRRDYEEDGGGGVGYMPSGHYSMDDPRRQSMQSFQTGDSDPGPNRSYLQGSALHALHRPSSNSSLSSAPGLIDGASSGRTRLGDRNSFDTRSVASSLDYQLIQNMENMTAAEVRHRAGSTSPGPVHLVGQRPSYSRQSHGSRTSSAHRQGSASPLHHQAPPRFHPYGAVASNSTGTVPSLPSSSHSPYGFQLPSLASIAQGNVNSEYVESLQSSSSGGVGTSGQRPKSLPRRSSQSVHRGPASRGSLASGDGPIQRGHVGGGGASNSGINPMFHVPTSGLSKSQSQHQPAMPPNGLLGSGQQILPPFSHLAAAAASTSHPNPEEEYLYSDRTPGRSRSHSTSYR